MVEDSAARRYNRFNSLALLAYTSLSSEANWVANYLLSVGARACLDLLISGLYLLKDFYGLLDWWLFLPPHIARQALRVRVIYVRMRLQCVRRLYLREALAISNLERKTEAYSKQEEKFLRRLACQIIVKTRGNGSIDRRRRQWFNTTTIRA